MGILDSEEIKHHFIEKDTNELVNIWVANDRDTYTEETFEAIRQILEEREIELPSQAEHIPPALRVDWDPNSVKNRRQIYLIFFFLMAAGSILASFVQLKYGFYANLGFGIIFLFLFADLVKEVLVFSTFSMITLVSVILFIPFISLLAIMIVDRGIFNAIKEREAALETMQETPTNEPYGL